MCSILDRLNQFKIHLLKPHSTNLTTTTSINLAATNAEGMIEPCAAFTFFIRLSAYIAILTLMALVIFLIMKYLTDLDYESNSNEVTTTETNLLRLRKAISFNYGTCGKDLESGCYSISSNGDGSSSSSSNSNSSAELYDGKVCVICYDEERNCFFVPCGHCATCYVCAQRIFNGENKVCPVCRRFIGKVRKLFAS